MSDIIAGVLSLLLGGYTTVDYIRKLRWRVNLLKIGERTNATVTGMFEIYETRIGTFHCPILTHTAYGKHHTVEYNFGSWLWKKYKIGQVVEAAYNKDNPKDIVIVHEWGVVIRHVFAILFGLLLIYGGLLMLADVILPYGVP